MCDLRVLQTAPHSGGGGWAGAMEQALGQESGQRIQVLAGPRRKGSSLPSTGVWGGGGGQRSQLLALSPPFPLLSVLKAGLCPQEGPELGTQRHTLSEAWGSLCMASVAQACPSPVGPFLLCPPSLTSLTLIVLWWFSSSL
jgi:hypothetical protein